MNSRNVRMGGGTRERGEEPVNGPLDTKYDGTHHSREPGVTVGVSPTLKSVDLRIFLSMNFFASALSLAEYSFSMAERSR